MLVTWRIFSKKTINSVRLSSACNMILILITCFSHSWVKGYTQSVFDVDEYPFSFSPTIMAAKNGPIAEATCVDIPFSTSMTAG